MVIVRLRLSSLVIVSMVLSTLLAVVPMGSAHAHPHAWIDVSVQILFNGAGKATGLRERWVFDEYYTAYAVGGLGKNSDTKAVQSKIDAILHDNMKNLEEYAYFTEVEHKGKGVDFAPITEMSSTLLGGRLEMTFVVPFKADLDLSDSPLTYSIFDPTYYIEMLHADSPEAIRLQASPAGCTYRLIKPNPTFEAVGLAAALDRTQTASDGLGAIFAERVDVQCP
ncbi:MAG: DUF1007 family protein [Rhodospirillales bacterium]|nr:DUF1007 family protein [Rhodospirillales bacterium]